MPVLVINVNVLVVLVGGELVEVIQIVELLVNVVDILVHDDERRRDVESVEERIVVGIERRRQLVRGGIESGIVVVAGSGGGFVVTFQGGDQRSESRTRIRVHAWTVPRRTAEWTVRRSRRSRVPGI